MKFNHNQAQAMVAPTQPQYFHLGTWVRIGHAYNAWLVVGMINLEKIVTRTTSVTVVGQGYMLYMCWAPTNTGKSNNICVYCGSKNHTWGNCTSQPNDNREEPRSTQRDLHSLGPHLGANTEYSGVIGGNTWKSTHFRPAPTKNLGNYIPAGQQVCTNNPFPYSDYRYDQNEAGHQQTRFDEKHNRQYSPNYNYKHYQPSPLVSIAGPDISATLINLANIQSRYLDFMVANQESQ